MILGDPVLRQVSQPVSAFDEDLKRLVDDLVQAMYAAPGVGLAAVQIGVLQRVAVIDVSVGRNPDDLFVMVNPRILSREGSQPGEEGCLSVPGYMEPLTRAERVDFTACDSEGREYSRTGEGLLARAVQHEVDHMDGKLFLSRLNRLKRRLIVRQIEKRRKLGDWP